MFHTLLLPIKRNKRRKIVCAKIKPGIQYFHGQEFIRPGKLFISFLSFVWFFTDPEHAGGISLYGLPVKEETNEGIF